MDGKWKEADIKFKQLVANGWTYDSTYNSKEEAKKIIKNRKSWGEKVDTVEYPNGIVAVFYKPFGKFHQI